MALNEGPIAGRRGIGGVSVDMLLVLMAVGLALTFAAVLYVAANVGGLVAHRAWPGLGFNDAVAGLGPVHHPGNPAVSYPPGIRARLPGPVIYWTVAVLMVVVPIVAAQFVWRRVAVGQQAKRRGLASRRRIRLAMGASGITARAKSLRPTLAQTRKPTVEDVAAPLGRSIPFNVECWVTCEESMAVAAPPRAGKSTQVIEPLVLNWRGPRLVTSSKTDLLQALWLGMMDLGSLWVLDHANLSGWANRSGWSLVSGCADIGTAQQRARVLVQASGAGGDTKDASTWTNGAAELLSCWLVAAAAAGRGAGEVLRWANNQADPTPIDILRWAGHAAMAAALAKYSTMDPEPRSSFYSLASQPLVALQRPEVLGFFDPAPERALDIGAWLDSEGTVLVLSDEPDGSPMTGPLSALVDAVVEEAKGRARRSYAGRLDPALLLALDELINICPLPQIPSLVSQSGGQGIFVAAILQNFAQAERRYGLVGLRMLLAASTVRVLLGGGVDAEDMERWGKLFGEYDQTTFSVQQSNSGMSMAGHIRRQPIYDSTQLRQLVERQALVSYRSLAPVMVHQDRTFDPGTRFCDQRKESMARFPTMTGPGQAVAVPSPGPPIEVPGFRR